MAKLTKKLPKRKLGKKKAPKEKKGKLVKKPKKSFDSKEFMRSLQTLDMQNYGSWPLAVKIFVILIIFLVIAALAYAIPISTKIDEIAAARAEQVTLLETYKEKESKARHLDTYTEQVAQMEVQFSELLNKLPKDTRVSELVQGINRTGIGSDIRFTDITIQPEQVREFFIEQPIRIEAVGEYHEFGSFLSGLATLPRIITLHDFEVNNSRPSLDTIPELTLLLNTQTYRSKPDTSETEADPSVSAPKE